MPTSHTTMYTPLLHTAMFLLVGVLADLQQTTTASIVHTSQSVMPTTPSYDVTTSSIHDVTSVSDLTTTSIYDVTSTKQVTTGSGTSVLPESSSARPTEVTTDRIRGSTEAVTMSSSGGSTGSTGSTDSTNSTNSTNSTGSTDSTDSTGSTETPTCAPCPACQGGNVVAAAVPMGIIIGIQFVFIVFLGLKQYRSNKFGFLFEEIR